MDMPEGYQPVYCLFTGSGSQEYLTAPLPCEAVRLVMTERQPTKYYSMFVTGVIIKARGSYFLRGGIPLYAHPDRNLLSDEVKHALSKD